MTGASNEIFFRASGRNFFIKGLAGGGLILSGTLRDEDFADIDAGRVNWSRTRSRIKAGNFGDPSRMAIASIDVGYQGRPLSVAPRFRWGVFAGYTYWNEVSDGYGSLTQPLPDAAPKALASVNAAMAAGGDDKDPFELSPPGIVELPGNLRVIRNNRIWHGPRLGIELAHPLTDSLTLKAEFAFLPALMLHDRDSHFIDGGPMPSHLIDGWGIGTQSQVALEWQALDNLKLGVGFRYWQARMTSGSMRAPDERGKAPIDKYTSDRMGGFAELTYAF